MSYEEARAKENEVLAKMRDSGPVVLNRGLKSDLPRDGAQTGFLVFLRYPKTVLSRIEEMSKAINRALNGRTIIYGMPNAHQTIANYIRTPGSDLARDRDALRALELSVNRIVDEGFDTNSIWNSFSGYLFNEHGVVLAPLKGMTPETHALIQKVVEYSRDNGLWVRPAPGAHKTVSRFTDDIPPSEIREFYDLMTGPKAAYPNAYADGDILFPVSLNVGFFKLSRNGFELTITAEIPFSNYLAR